jgi:hypothetical protein
LEQWGYGSPVVLTSENGRKVNITCIFWSLVREARHFELYGQSSMRQVEKAGHLLVAALGHGAMTQIIELMSNHVPDDYKAAVSACWKGIVDECASDDRRSA